MNVNNVNNIAPPQQSSSNFNYSNTIMITLLEQNRVFVNQIQQLIQQPPAFSPTSVHSTGSNEYL